MTSQSDVVLKQMQARVRDRGTRFSLALPREDVSYIGADMAGNLFAIATDATVLWGRQLGAVATPLYATADGGVIATSTSPCGQQVSEHPYGRPPSPLGTPSSRLGSLYTLDQNANGTSQTPDITSSAGRRRLVVCWERVSVS